jgi:hypothetical protein
MSMSLRAWHVKFQLAVLGCALSVSSALVSAQVQKDSELSRLAQQQFRHLTELELRMVQAAAMGQVAWGDLQPSKPGDTENLYALAKNPVYDVANISKDRRIHAEVIQWLYANEKARALLDSHGIEVVGAWIIGRLELAYVRGVNLPPIILVNCRIPDGVSVRSAEFSDLVLDRSWIGESRAWMVDHRHVALDGAGAKIHGNILLSNGFKAAGQVDLYAAQIDGELYGHGGQFLNLGEDEPTLRLRLANIAGEVDLSGLMSDGLVEAVNSKIGGALNFDQAIFSGALKNGLKAKSLTAHALTWTNVRKSENTVLDLSHAKVAVFRDDEASWPNAGLLILNGFEYDSLDEDDNARSNVTARLQWLRRQNPYEPQPYKQLAKVFLENGQDSDAITVLAAKEADLRQQTELPDDVWKQHLLDTRNLLMAEVRLLVRGILWLTIDYGYRPLRALWWIVGFVAVGTFTFYCGYQAQLIIPTDHEAYQTFTKTGTPPPDYQPFNSFVYSLETFVPLIVLHQASYWLPQPSYWLPQPDNKSHSNAIYSGRALRWYLWLHILLGWVFTSMLFAGLTGLIRNG